MTLTQVLNKYGYTHRKSEHDGKQDIYKDGEYEFTATAQQCWDWLRERGMYE